jgi:hypothetical protein
MCPTAFIVTCPFHWQRAPGPPYRRRACPVRCRNSAPVLCSALYSALVREASPTRRDYTRSRVAGRERMAPAEDISGYIRYVPGPTCRGSALLYMSPFSYKRGGMQRYKTGSIWRLRPSSFHSNPTHSGVGYYAPAARTTLNSRVFMCLMFA